MAVQRRLRSEDPRVGSPRRSRRMEDPGRATAGHFGHAQVVAMQRSRILTAAVESVDELGWEGASIARITERARVSRRTFYELFENREECLVAVLRTAVARISQEIAAAELTGLHWRGRVRGGLWAILCFFDREPALARVCIVESRRGGGVVLAYRQEIVKHLAEIVDQGRREGSSSNGSALTAYGVIGGVSEVLYSEFLSARREPLRELLGQLTGMILLPYAGATAAQGELTRPHPTLHSAEQSDDEPTTTSSASSAALPMRLTYRTAKVLQTLAEHPGQSNRDLAELVGIADQGQMSKLLARLARLGLLANGGPVKGERNKWTLTPTGSQVTRSIQAYTSNTQTAKQVTRSRER